MAIPSSQKHMPLTEAQLEFNEARDKQYRKAQERVSKLRHQSRSGASADERDPAKPRPTPKSSLKPNGTITTSASEKAPVKPQSTFKSNPKLNGTTTTSASKKVSTKPQATPKSNPKRDETSPVHKAFGLATKTIAYCASITTRGSKASSQHRGRVSKVIEAQGVEGTNVISVTSSGNIPSSTLVGDLEVVHQTPALLPLTT